MPAAERSAALSCGLFSKLPAAASLPLTPRPHNRSTFGIMRGFLTTDGEISAQPWEGGPTDLVQRTRETPKAEGTGRVGKKNSSGREGRRRQPHLRRGALALPRPALLRALPGNDKQLLAKKDRICCSRFSLGRRPALHACSGSDFHPTSQQKNKRCLQQLVYNNNASAYSGHVIGNEVTAHNPESPSSSPGLGKRNQWQRHESKSDPFGSRSC